MSEFGGSVRISFHRSITLAGNSRGDPYHYLQL